MIHNNPLNSPSALAHPGQRIAIIGSTCSGKTTLARQLAERQGHVHVELDALHWEANWTHAPLEVFRERVSQTLSGQAWVIDGNYSEVRDIVWGRADTIVWLDYPLPLILWRLTRRHISRMTQRTELWNGNRETFRRAFFSRDSLYLWALQTHQRRRREFSQLFANPPYPHLTTIRLRSPRSTAQWLASIAAR